MRVGTPLITAKYKFVLRNTGLLEYAFSLYPFFKQLMKVKSAIVFCIGLLILTVSVTAQLPSKSLSKEVLSELVAKRGSDSPFVILSPSEQKELDLGDPCDTAALIIFGETINGSLSATDCQLPDLSYADFYLFHGTAGQQVTINLTSSAFDTYLGLANEGGTFVIEDNDGGGGTNSRIIANLPETGFYLILANSWLPNSFGPYSVSLNAPAPCTFSLDPVSHDIPGNGGTYSFAVNTQPGCYWSVNYDVYGFINFVTSGGTGPGTVTYTANPNAGPNPDGTPRSMVIRVNNVIFTINQSYLACTYSIAPGSANHGPDAGTYEFQMNTAVGCPWIAYYGQSNYWLWTSNELKRGPGPVVYTVSANNQADRTGTITVAGHTYTVNQSGRNCTYGVSPRNVQVSPAGGQGTITVTTQPGCTWSFWYGYSWVDFPYGSNGVGPGTVAYRAYANSTYSPRTWTVGFSETNTLNVLFSQAGIPFRTPFDFFGDSKADLSLFRPSTNEWILRDSQSGTTHTYQFGLPGDIRVPGDFNGDRYTEIAAFRPANGTWYLFDRYANTYSAIPFGIQDDIPAPADYDGDGKTDIAVFRPSTGIWYILRTSDVGVTISRFGVDGDAPVPADYDGDRKADIAIWRPAAGEWWYAGSAGGGLAMQFGTSTDRAVPGDYTGDGRADIAFWRPSNGYWYVLRSEDFSYFSFPYGISEDLPAPGDYDADGIFDVAVFRPSNATWYVNRSASTSLTAPMGQTGDLPVPGSYVR
jgi:hypothetical protein